MMKTYVVIYNYGGDIVFACNTKADTEEQAIKNTEFMPSFYGCDYDDVKVIEQKGV